MLGYAHVAGELYLLCSALAVLVFNAYLINNPKNKYPILNNEIFFQVLSILFITFFLLTNVQSTTICYDFFFYQTPTIQNLKIFLLFFFIQIFILIWRSFIAQKLNFFEYFIILIIVLIGLFFLLAAHNLISIYLCLEIQALGFYILAAFDRASIFSSEAGLKYFISSSLISGIFLFGTALLYGSLGTLNVYEILFLTTYFSNCFVDTSYFFLIFGSFLIIKSLLFKLVIAPYHFWFPQIYDGAPLSSTIAFSLLPKIALVNLFIKIWSSISTIISTFNTFFLLVGIYCTFFGVFKMLKQKRLKKLYIYSSISNFGLLFCILIDNSFDSITVIYFFLLIYLITSILFWLIFIFIYSNEIKKYNTTNINFPIFLNSFNSLFYQNKLLGISICFVFFSLAAIPPFVGFFSKLYIFVVLLKNHQYEIAIFLIYIGVFGSYYYIKFLKIMCFENISLKNQTQNKNFFPIKFFNIDATLYSCSLFFLIFSFFNTKLVLNFIFLLIGL